MFFFILGLLVHPYMVFYSFGAWMVKFNIGLNMSEMKKIFNYRLSTTLWPLQQLGITRNSLRWNFITNKTWCNKLNYIMIFQSWELQKLKTVTTIFGTLYCECTHVFEFVLPKNGNWYVIQYIFWIFFFWNEFTFFKCI